MPTDRGDDTSYREAYADPSVDNSSVGMPLLPEIRMVGQARFTTAQRYGLPPHQHENAFEICYVLEGSLYWHLGEKTYSLHRGDLFVAPPNVAHGGEDAVMQPCEIYWVQVVIPISGHPLPGMTPEETKSVYHSLCAAAVSPAFACVSPEKIESAFAILMQEHRQGSFGSALRAVAARSALHAILVQTVRDAAESACTATQVSAPLFQALRWMEAHLGEPFRIDDVASVAGFSIAAFHEHFQREVGTTPSEWRTQKRIERAKTCLIREMEKSVTEIALMLGFGSSQYFATAFKRYTARTPTEYRGEHQNAAGV